MTIETSASIQLKDVKSFEFECAQCHAKVAIPVESNKGFPARCSHCDAQWTTYGGEEFSNWTRFLILFQRFAAAPNIPFVFSIKINAQDLAVPRPPSPADR